MNQIITAEAEEKLLPASTRAIQITERIKANGRTAVNAVCAIGKDLRTMKIDKLYKELGYEEFEEYAEKEFQLKRSQTYQYISVFEKLGEEFVQSNAQLGITKLALLATANPEDRAEVMQENNVAGITTKELEELLSKYKEQGEQLSLLQGEQEKLEADLTEKKNAEADKERMIFALKQKIEELENAPKDVEVATKEIIKEVPYKKTEKKLKDTEKDLLETKKKLEELSQKSRDEINATKAEYEARIAELTSKAEKPAENSDKTSFKTLLTSAYKELTGLIAFIEEADEEDKELYISKARQILDSARASLEDI